MEYPGRSAVPSGDCAEQASGWHGCSSTQSGAADDHNTEVSRLDCTAIGTAKGSRESTKDPSYYLPDGDAAYMTDDFRMFTHKVERCPKRFRHDWTSCNFAHPGEKAGRRDLKNWEYTGIACPEMKQERSCKWGRDCPYAHNVFEYWLHPTRYRTQLCRHTKKLSACPNRICFFAHSHAELRKYVPKPSISPEKLMLIHGPNADIESLFSAMLQIAAPPAKDFGLWRDWSPMSTEGPLRRSELAGAGYQEPSRQEGALLGNILGLNMFQSRAEQQASQRRGDLLFQTLGNFNSEAQPGFLGDADSRALLAYSGNVSTRNKPPAMDFLRQSVGRPINAPNTLAANPVPRFLNPVENMQWVPSLDETRTFDHMASGSGPPMGAQYNNTAVGPGMPQSASFVRPTSLQDINMLASFMSWPPLCMPSTAHNSNNNLLGALVPQSPSFVSPTSRLDSGYSSYTYGARRTMHDIEIMSGQYWGVTDESAAAHIRAVLAQQPQRDPFAPGLFDGYGGFPRNHGDSEGSSAPGNEAAGNPNMMPRYMFWDDKR